MISREQRATLNRELRQGLQAFHVAAPQSCSDYADEHFYLSAESSYLEGRWETLPFQRAILNAMGNDDIRVVNLIKSARVGYTKMILAAMCYFASHKKRNQMLWQPTDGDAKDFMKAHVEPSLRDVPAMRDIAPWVGKKHRNNTLERKLFANSRSIYVRGGEAARNYREKSVDVVYYDELSSFSEDIEKEGSPVELGDKRVEGAIFGKSIRGSTPKTAGTCQMEAAAEEADETFRCHVPCPECDEFQTLEFGGTDADFGLKWDVTDTGPENVRYQCKHCQECWPNEQLVDVMPRCEWRSDSGLVTVDGELFYLDGRPADTPESVTFTIWSIYNQIVVGGWKKIVRDFLKAKETPTKLKTFVNTTLGETWQEQANKQFNWELLFQRRTIYSVPDAVLYITIGVDVQDDRFEWEVIGWGHDETSWSLDYGVLVGNPAQPMLWQLLFQSLQKPFTRDDGVILMPGTVCIDSGGHFTDEVYAFSRKYGLLNYVPIKGANKAGKPIATFPAKRSRKGVYLVEVGTDNAKDLIYQRLLLEPAGDEDGVHYPAGYCHFPLNDETHGPRFFKGLTAEKKVERRTAGKRVYRWECPSGARNEPLDCRVYGMAALRVAQQRKGLILANLDPNNAPPPQPAKRRRVISRGIQ